MAKNKKPSKGDFFSDSKDNSEVTILTISGGYAVSFRGSMKLKNGQENFEAFTGRVDNLSNDLRNKIIRTVAQHLGVNVRFTE